MEPNLYVAISLAFAGLVHSGFSLGASMLTLLSGHSLSRRRSHARILWLTGGFVVGSFAMILLLTLALTYAGMLAFALGYPVAILALGTLTMLAGLWVTFFYHRRQHGGTVLWLPRPFARYLAERTARTKTAAESFVLGGASVIYELPVTIWLVLIAATAIPTVAPVWQVPMAIGYSLLAVLSLIVIFILIGGGHTSASLTRFRTRNRQFIQVLVGLSMILLGASIFWNEFSAVMSAQGTVLW